MGIFTKSRHARLMVGAAACALALGANAARAQGKPITIAPQTLASALHDFGAQTGRQIMFTPESAASKMSHGVDGAADEGVALAQLLQGTGLTWRKSGDTYLVVGGSDPQAESAGGGAETNVVQELVVTAQKKSENIQVVPIAISAFTQQDLTTRQVAGGPDLMTQVPNMTFTKTNFSGYSIQIRGIGTQAISATTDAAVAVAFNNTPFIRNRFFEQEFYDLERIEVLRGPQGTLYGRNATAGVVNILSAKPTFNYAERISGDVANYNSKRLEGMVNMPLADDKLALRLAGAWTKRDGYDTNQITGSQIDGRDLWSTRASLRFAPTDKIEANLIWEHFEENDDRLRSGKQLCHQDDRTEIGGYAVTIPSYSNVFSQGCLAASLYGSESYEAPNGQSLPYYLPLRLLSLPVKPGFNPYASLVQSPDLRVIESTVDPEYRAKSDLVEFQASVDLGDSLTLTSETGYNFDNLFSLEDYNRFNTAHGAFIPAEEATSSFDRPGVLLPGDFGGGVFCDPQIGCADRLVAVDVSTARSRQFSQELRLSSDYSGPFNFSLGANFLRYDTEDKYYVFINTLSMFAAEGGYDTQGLPTPYIAGVSDNHECLPNGGIAPNPTESQLLSGCIYMDPNPIGSLNDMGHNYFLSKNPYKLISYAAFGEIYYNLTDTLKITGGLRWTVDKKEAPRIPSWVLGSDTLGYPVMEVERQEWREPTGRLAIDWRPDLGFTDQTLLYASYAHGYKAGGSNPPPSGIVGWGLSGLKRSDVLDGLIEQSVAKPKIFKAEFVNAFEIGAKNTLLDGRLTLNANAFYYDYQDYQISQIIDRSAVNYNFDARIWGVEVEADWRPLKNLRLGFKGGYENTRVADGQHAIDIMDRTGGHSDWVVVRPFPSFPSNCIVPLYSLASANGLQLGPNLFEGGHMGPCEVAYVQGFDPVTSLPYVPNPTVAATDTPGVTQPLVDFPGYIGYDPKVDVGQNHGEGFFTDLSGHELPNAPHYTATITLDYTAPLPHDWLATLHADIYGQSEAWTRIFNTPGYDRFKAYTNVNLAAILTNDTAGLKAMFYVKNIFDRDSITGAFLNSDDTGLTTNVFLTEPRLFGVRVTKDWTGVPFWGPLGGGAGRDHPAGAPYPLTLELGGTLQHMRAPYDPVRSAGAFTGAIDPALAQDRGLDWGQGGEAKLTYALPESPWRLWSGVRFGKAKGKGVLNASQPGDSACIAAPPYESYCSNPKYFFHSTDWIRGATADRERRLLVDFAVGRDFGLGSSGGSGLRSTLSAGLRYADFESRASLDATGVPDWDIPEGAWVKYSQHHFYKTDLSSKRTFKGVGPALTWEGSKSLKDGGEAGRVDLDWSVSAGVLFGRQKAVAGGRELATYYSGKYVKNPVAPAGPPAPTPQPAPRSTSATVPTLGGSLGVSYAIQRVKLGAGYRWERYFHLLDAGYADRRTYDRTIDGPYFKLSLGFGG